MSPLPAKGRPFSNTKKDPVITMSDLARLARVSSATVSLCMSGSSKISSETRERVLTLARAHGYQPNPMVSALMRYRRRRTPTERSVSLALVHCLPVGAGQRPPLSPGMCNVREGAYARAAENGYSLSEFWFGESGISAARLSQILVARGVRGVLLGPPEAGVAMPELVWSDFSVVGLSQAHKVRSIHVVCRDQEHGLRRAIHECTSRGFRRLGIVASWDRCGEIHGFVEVARQTAGAGLPDVSYFTGPLDGATGELKQWLSTAAPEAILSYDTAKLEAALVKLGVRVPADLAMVDLDEVAGGERLSGICDLGQKIGATAVDTLAGLIERGERGLSEQPITTLLSGAWNSGSTLERSTGHGQVFGVAR